MYVSTYVLLAMCVCVMCVSALLNPFSYYYNADYNDNDDDNDNK